MTRKGAFFWDDSVYSNSGIDGTCVLLGAIPFPNERNAIPFILLPVAESGRNSILAEKLRVRAGLFWSRQLFRFRNSARSVLLGTDILCILLFLFWNRNKRKSPKRTRPIAHATFWRSKRQLCFLLAAFHYPDQVLVDGPVFCHIRPTSPPSSLVSSLASVWSWLSYSVLVERRRSAWYVALCFARFSTIYLFCQ